ISPQYHNDGVLYTADASRAVGVATQLLSPEMKPKLLADYAADYEKIRTRLANKQPKAAKLSYQESVENGFKIDFDKNAPVKPNFIGSETFTNYPLEALVEYFDWTPFFISWSLAGNFAKILEDDVEDEPVRELYEQADRK